MAKYSLSRRVKKIKDSLTLFFNKRVKKSVYTKDILFNTLLTAGEFTYGEPAILQFPNGENGQIIIGKFCSIAPEVTFFTGGNHRIDWVSTYPFNQFSSSFPDAASIKGQPFAKGNIVIGNDVWIGQGAVILSGVNIGDGAVIGAYTVVAKDVAPYEVVVGNPMRKIKKRFDEETITKLLDIKWWDWSIEKIKRETLDLCSENIQQFIKKHQ